MVVRENMKNHLQQREHNQRERQITVNTEELSGYGYLCWKNRHRAECTKDLLFKGIFWCYLLFRLILFSACLKQALRFPGEVSGQRHSAQAFCAGSYNATAGLTTWAACQGAVTQAQPTWIGNIGMERRTIQNGIRNSSTTWEKMQGWCATGRGLSEESLIPWFFSL